MTDAEVITALGALVLTVRVVDLEKAAWALNAVGAGQYDRAHDAVTDIAWGCFKSTEPYPDGLLAVMAELATRRRRARPYDFTPPSHYGHLRG